MGWNGSDLTGSRKPLSNSCKKASNNSNKLLKPLIFGGLIITAITVLFILLFSNQTSDNIPSVEEEKPLVKAKPKKKNIVTIPQETAKDEAPKIKTEKEKLREKIKALTPEERLDLAFKMKQAQKIDLTPTTNTPFRTGIELSMARIFMTRVGFPPPPLHTTFLPIQDEAHLAEILAAANPVIEGDSEEIKEAKATVEMVKKEMLAYIKEGGHPEDFMAHYYDKLQSAFVERRDSLKEIARVAIEEPEIAQDFYKKVNERLISKGITPIELTDRQKQRLGLE